ncbi:hypothetical protein L1887_48610 [Cichorium endivia]|nr:hypothetical protein L1887_48610 [Cichorium endivia]
MRRVLLPVAGVARKPDERDSYETSDSGEVARSGRRNMGGVDAAERLNDTVVGSHDEDGVELQYEPREPLLALIPGEPALPYPSSCPSLTQPLWSSYSCSRTRKATPTSESKGTRKPMRTLTSITATSPSHHLLLLCSIGTLPYSSNGTTITAQPPTQLPTSKTSVLALPCCSHGMLLHCSKGTLFHCSNGNKWPDQHDAAAPQEDEERPHARLLLLQSHHHHHAAMADEVGKHAHAPNEHQGKTQKHHVPASIDDTKLLVKHAATPRRHGFWGGGCSRTCTIRARMRDESARTAATQASSSSIVLGLHRSQLRQLELDRRGGGRARPCNVVVLFPFDHAHFFPPGRRPLPSRPARRATRADFTTRRARRVRPATERWCVSMCKRVLRASTSIDKRAAASPACSQEVRAYARTGPTAERCSAVRLGATSSVGEQAHTAARESLSKASRNCDSDSVEEASRSKLAARQRCEAPNESAKPSEETLDDAEASQDEESTAARAGIVMERAA